jgi:hypothetical protein
VAGAERIHVDSAIVLAGGSVQVFFAKEVTTTTPVTYGTRTNRNFQIYTETVNP